MSMARATQATFVIPAKAGTQSVLPSRATPWVPAFAGMTNEGVGMMSEGSAG